MRTRTVTGVLSLAAAAWGALGAGCDGSNLECGPGTHAEGNRCVPDTTEDGGTDGVDVPGEAEDGTPSDGELPEDAEPDDAGDSVDEAEATCEACVDGTRRCQGLQVQGCVTLTDGCTTWRVEETCTRFEECREPELDCVVPETEPTGSFVAPVSGASWGIAAESLLWDGTTGLASFSTADGGARVLGFLRFNAAGPVRPARTSSVDEQESSLARAGSRIFVHWRDSGSHGSLGEVLADETLGTTIGTDHASMGQNVHAWGVGSGVFLYQTSVMGGSNAYTGFFDPASWSITWYADQPLFTWYASSAAATETASGFAAAWITPEMTTVALQRFNAAGTPVGAATVSPLGFAAGDTTALALRADAEGFTFVWVTDAVLHLTRFGADGTRTADAAVASGDLAFRNPGWVGADGEELFVSCSPDTRGSSLVIARVSPAGVLRGDELLSSRHGIARYAAGTVAACWGVADEGVGCAVVPFP